MIKSVIIYFLVLLTTGMVDSYHLSDISREGYEQSSHKLPTNNNKVRVGCGGGTIDMPPSDYDGGGSDGDLR